ncbi:hypothetical protein EJB05_36500, partial [Eragrostis curvula]
MSDARHDHHQRHLSGGDFQFHEDDLASLFAQRPEAGTPMQQPWFTDYLHASAATPLDYDSFAGEFDVPAAEEVKRELAVDTGAAASGGGIPGGAASSAPLTPNSMSLSSTSSEACGAGAGAGEEAAGKCKKEEGEGEESKEGSAAKADGDMDDKNKKG